MMVVSIWQIINVHVLHMAVRVWEFGLCFCSTTRFGVSFTWCYYAWRQAVIDLIIDYAFHYREVISWRELCVE